MQHCPRHGERDAGSLPAVQCYYKSGTRRWNAVPQEAVASAGQPFSYVLPSNTETQPGLVVTPQIEAPSLAELKPRRVRSRKVPNFSSVGFW